ncbi:MAG: group II intron reverse transcriptase/maturase, partial [Oscillospiraceae bacterium]
HCHHKLPLSMGGTDKYNNLIILDEQVHQLLHATLSETTAQYLGILQLTKNQLQKLNQLRKQANLSEIHC